MKTLRGYDPDELPTAQELSELEAEARQEREAAIAEARLAHFPTQRTRDGD